ncbi:MAG: hypothetical protein R3E68_12200 [Burkholderiaceae bacterium]
MNLLHGDVQNVDADVAASLGARKVDKDELCWPSRTSSASAPT